MEGLYPKVLYDDSRFLLHPTLPHFPPGRLLLTEAKSKFDPLCEWLATEGTERGQEGKCFVGNLLRMVKIGGDGQPRLPPTVMKAAPAKRVGKEWKNEALTVRSFGQVWIITSLVREEELDAAAAEHKKMFFLSKFGRHRRRE